MSVRRSIGTGVTVKHCAYNKVIKHFLKHNQGFTYDPECTLIFDGKLIIVHNLRIAVVDCDQDYIDILIDNVKYLRSKMIKQDYKIIFMKFDETELIF